MATPIAPPTAPDLSEVVVVLRLWCQLQSCQEFWVFALKELVEDVEVSLPWSLRDNARLLQQVVVDVSTNWSSLCVYRIEYL